VNHKATPDLNTLRGEVETSPLGTSEFGLLVNIGNGSGDIRASVVIFSFGIKSPVNTGM
jgi:hypothetical protein